MDEQKFGGRAVFQATAQPSAALVIDNTTRADSGLYRCRVDYTKSPTRNVRVQLRVISEYRVENLFCSLCCLATKSSKVLYLLVLRLRG